MVIWETTTEPNVEWPDLSKDRQAWERAKRELPAASFSEIAALAQKIKETL